MIDKLGRTIEYLRISVTDRCNLRCVYCMPEKGIEKCSHEAVLRYDEITRLVKIFAALGVKKIRLTGGEPLVRPDLHILIKAIKQIPGIEKVCITTNGILLQEQLPLLMKAGLDSVNISIDTLNPQTFQVITRRNSIGQVLDSINTALSYPDLKVKLNCVPSEFNKDELVDMTAYFLKKNCSLRFIEMMPIGYGKTVQGIDTDTLKGILAEELGQLREAEGELMGGPCSYYKIDRLPGTVGFISAMTHQFCHCCNRVRLTSTGFLKTCLQYDKGIQLKGLLQQEDAVLEDAIYKAVLQKPQRHHFTDGIVQNEETKMMSQIGG